MRIGPIALLPCFAGAALLLWGCAAGPTRVPARPQPLAAREPATSPAASRPTSRPAPLPAPRTVIGQSIRGRPIEMVRFGTAPRPLLVIAGIHGDEPTSWYLAERLIELLESSPESIGGGSVVVIPRANPDGCAAGTRTNARGVDLNRNYPASNWKLTRRGREYAGPKPASEPETAALIRAVESCEPGRIVSVHSIDAARHCNNYDGPGRELAEAMSRLNGYPVAPTIGYPTPGSFGTWAGTDRRLPVITLELPRGLLGEKAWEANRAAILAAASAGYNARP